MIDLIFRRTGKFIIEGNDKPLIQEVINYMRDLSILGYYVDFEDLQLVTLETMTNSLKFLNEYTKNNQMQRSKPFYINFPEQVENMSEGEIYLNAILHYWIGLNRERIDTKLERPKLNGDFKLKRLKLTAEEEQTIVGEIGENIIYQKVSYSQQDKEDLEKLKEFLSDSIFSFNEILIKENKFYIINLLQSNEDLKNNRTFKCFIDNFDTPTDILRYLAYTYAEKDTSLSTPIKFKAMKRKLRKLIMVLLDNMCGKEEDILRYKPYWKKLAHFVHPYEYKQYKTAIKLFGIAVNDVKVETFNSKTEELIKNKDWNTLCKHLEKRPTEFVRRLILIIKNLNRIDIFQQSLLNVLPQASTSSIISLINKLLNEEQLFTMYVPKSLDMKFYTKETNKKDLSEECKEGLIWLFKNELKDRFSKLDYLGKVYLDEKLKSYNIPMQIRSLSKSQNVVARWSRFKIPEDKNIIRSFIHWKNIEGERVDVDSAFGLFDKDGKLLDNCSYYEIKSNYETMIHSGDIVDSPNGAIEYLDLDINKTIEKLPQAKYLLMSVYSFTGQSMKEIPECFGGWMYREEAKTGELYESKSVENVFEFTNNGTSIIPMAIDLQSREIIWLDINSSSSGINQNMNEDSKRLKYFIKGLVSKEKYMSLYDLFELHNTRYEVVDKKEDTDVIFSELGIEDILNNYLV